MRSIRDKRPFKGHSIVAENNRNTSFDHVSRLPHSYTRSISYNY